MSEKILFQGDSITDWGRDYQDPSSLGHGYPYLIKGALGLEKPLGYEFINRGISGNRIVDLYARIKADFINIKPDYASIYIGVNDVWHGIAHDNGVVTEKFEKIYTMLLDEVFAACPDLKLMLIAPFVLNGSATCNTEERPNRWTLFRTEVDEKSAVVKRLSEKYGLPLIELQPEFDRALEKAPVGYWTLEGVHPTVSGHELIKNLWIKTFKKM